MRVGFVATADFESKFLLYVKTRPGVIDNHINKLNSMREVLFKMSEHGVLK